MTSEVPGHLRTNNTAYREAWTPYIREIARLSKHNQITEGGPIIAVQVDNEYSQKEEVGFPGKAGMMRDLEDELRAGGIIVPLTYNDARPQGSFVKGVGAVDIYGLDSYPQVSEVQHASHHPESFLISLSAFRLFEPDCLEPGGRELLRLPHEDESKATLVHT